MGMEICTDGANIFLQSVCTPVGAHSTLFGFEHRSLIVLTAHQSHQCDLENGAILLMVYSIRQQVHELGMCLFSVPKEYQWVSRYTGEILGRNWGLRKAMDSMGAGMKCQGFRLTGSAIHLLLPIAS
jgi:hypothetical protein